MKTYVLTVRPTFPATHPRKGQQTYFIEKILKALRKWVVLPDFAVIGLDPKLHTIRGNYDLWAKRMKEVQEGKAIISLRYWSGKPYNSKQIEFAQLDKDSGCGVQKLWFLDANINYPHLALMSDVLGLRVSTIAKNDGLSFQDFEDWFKGYDLSKPMAMIHFTKFRY